MSTAIALKDCEMKITDINTRLVTIPLITTFKTALRSVDWIENIFVTVLTDSAQVGFGSAAPAAVITGETVSSIIGRYDLDAPLFCSMNPAVGGISYQGSRVCFSDAPGLGIDEISNE